MAKSQPAGRTQLASVTGHEPPPPVAGHEFIQEGKSTKAPREATSNGATENIDATKNIDAAEKTLTEALSLPTQAQIREDYNSLSQAKNTTDKKNTWQQTQVDLPRQKITWQGDPPQAFAKQPDQKEPHPIIQKLTAFGLDENKYPQCLWACSQASVAQSMVKTELQKLSSKITDQDITLTPQQDGSIQITNQRTYSLECPTDAGLTPVIHYTMSIMSIFHRDKGFTSVQESITGLKSENVAAMDKLSAPEKKEIKEIQSTNLSRIQAVQTAMAQQSLLEDLRNTQKTSDRQAPINLETITQIVQARAQLTQAERALEDSYPNELRFAATLKEEGQEWYDIQNIMSEQEKGNHRPTAKEEHQGIREIDKFNLKQLNKDGKRDFGNQTEISWGNTKKIPLKTFLQEVSTAIDPKEEWTDPSEDELNPNSTTPFLDLTSEHKRKMMHAFLPLLQTHTTIQNNQLHNLLHQGSIGTEVITLCTRDNQIAPKIDYNVNSENKIVCKKTTPWLLTFRSLHTSDYASVQPLTYTEHLVFDKETSQWERTAQSIDINKDPSYSVKEIQIREDGKEESIDKRISQKDYKEGIELVLKGQNSELTFEDITREIDPLQSKVKDTLQGFNDRRATEQKCATAERILANIANQPTPDPSQMTQLAQLTQEALIEATEQLQKTLQEKTDEYDSACENFNTQYREYLEIVKDLPQTSLFQKIMLILQDLFTRIHNTFFKNDPWVSVLEQQSIMEEIIPDKGLADSTHIVSHKAMPEAQFTQALEETKKIAAMKKNTETLSLSIEKLKQNAPPKYDNYINKIRTGHYHHILYSANERQVAWHHKENLEDEDIVRKHENTLNDILRQAPNKSASLDFLLDTVADTLAHVPDTPGQPDREKYMAELRTHLHTTEEANKIDTAIETVLKWITYEQPDGGPATQCLQALWMRAQAATMTMLTPFEAMPLDEITNLQPIPDTKNINFTWQYNETGIVCETQLPCQLVYIENGEPKPALSVTLVSKQTYDFQKGCVVGYSERVGSLQVAEGIPIQHQEAAAKARIYFAEYEQFLTSKNPRKKTLENAIKDSLSQQQYNRATSSPTLSTTSGKSKIEGLQERLSTSEIEHRISQHRIQHQNQPNRAQSCPPHMITRKP